MVGIYYQLSISITYFFEGGYFIMLKDTELIKLISEFVQNSKLNYVKELDNLRIFDTPLVGFASADDSLFEKFKEDNIIGKHHQSPNEWLPGSKTVISYFLPFTARVRETNRSDIDLPSREWLYGRIEGQEFNNALSQFINNTLESIGGKAIIPALDSRFKIISKKSNWSERHIAYAAGLGTFNLSKSLITKKGCAGRYGSVITNIEYQPTKRQYSNIYEYCNNCGACIKRCPAHAITKYGKNHDLCSKYIDEIILPKYTPRYGCGKCQTGVPCENSIPNIISILI
jgi:epoxyqueuosine reductase